MAGTSGVSAYLIPYSLQGKEESKWNLFKALNPQVSSQKLQEFSSEEKQKLESLKNSFNQLSEALNNSIQLRNLKYSSLDNLLKSILKSDTKLFDFYQKSQEIVKKLSDLNEQLKQKNSNKLETESFLGKNDYAVSLLDQIGKSIDSLNQLIEPIVEVIEQEKQQQAVGGGHQQVEKKSEESQASQEAKKALKEVKDSFEKIQLIFGILYLKKEQISAKLLLEKDNLTFYHNFLKVNIARLQLLISELNDEIIKKRLEINKEIDELNKLKKELKKTNEEWEYSKEKIISFRNYQGIFKNAICKNSEFEHKDFKESQKINCEFFKSNSLSN